MTVEHETRLYLEDRIFEGAVKRGAIRRPIGFLDPSTLKRKLYDAFTGDPLTADVPKGWKPDVVKQRSIPKGA